MAKGTFTECPKCGARVTKEKLRRHVNKVHGEGATKQAPAPKPTHVSTVRFPWKATAALAVVGLVIVAGWFVTQSMTGGSPPSSSPDRFAVIETNLGTMRIHLAMDSAQATATHFINLVQSGTYDGKEFYRVAYGTDPQQSIHVIQAGVRNPAGIGTVAWQRTGLPNEAYSISMARSGQPNNPADKDTASSEFFINVRNNPALDSYTYAYVVFGHVIGGQSLVDQIGNLHGGQTSYDGVPKDSGGNTVTVTILRITIEA